MLGAPQGRPEYKAIGHALNVRMVGTSLDRVVPHGWIYEWMGPKLNQIRNGYINISVDCSD